VIDGGSADKTLEMVATEGQHVSVLVSEKDGGIYDAMNKGIALATGDIVGFINADDFYAATDVLAQIAKIFEDQTIDACYGDLCYVKQDNTESIVRFWRSSDFKPRLFLSGWCPPHPTFFVRKSTYDQFGGFDLSYRIAADTELMVRFLMAHRVRSYYFPRILVKMRMGGTTNKSIGNVIKQNCEIWRALKKHGLRPSLVRFIGGKLLSRGNQFLFHPK
jgi:glycosyltransferase involved in cell wall biosynthesis